METELQQRQENVRPLGVSGLGGWLVLTQIGLYITLLILIFQIFNVNLPALAPDVWGILTSTDSPVYHPLWGPIIIFELVYNVLFFVFCIFILVMFYSKKAMLPRLMIIFYGMSLFIAILDVVLVYQIPFTREFEDGSSYKDIIRGIFTCAIWIPYFLKSERVKNTFIR